MTHHARGRRHANCRGAVRRVSSNCEPCLNSRQKSAPARAEPPEMRSRAAASQSLQPSWAVCGAQREGRHGQRSCSPARQPPLRGSACVPSSASHPKPSRHEAAKPAPPESERSNLHMRRPGRTGSSTRARTRQKQPTARAAGGAGACRRRRPSAGELCTRTRALTPREQLAHPPLPLAPKTQPHSPAPPRSIRAAPPPSDTTPPFRPARTASAGPWPAGDTERLPAPHTCRPPPAGDCRPARAHASTRKQRPRALADIPPHGLN